MNNNRLKSVVFGIMEGPTKPVRHRREWQDDVQEWYNMDILLTVPTGQRNIESCCQ